MGSLWESRTNIGAVLLEAGLARLQTGFGADRIPDSQILSQAEQSAKLQKLKVCHCVMYLVILNIMFVNNHFHYFLFFPPLPKDLGKLC